MKTKFGIVGCGYSGQLPESRRNDDAGAVHGAGGDRGG